MHAPASAGSVWTDLQRRKWLALPLSLAAGRLAAATADTTPPRTLRIATASETGFDPARVGDVPSLQILAHLFEPLYGYDPLARPVKLIARAAAALPQHSADFREWTVPVRRGVHFAPHAAFGGRLRELTAEDFVYSIKRFADPAMKSPGWSTLEPNRIVGLSELRRAAVEGRKPLDYDQPIAGLQALDRYTLRIRLEQPRPRFPQELAGTAMGAVAREVIEAVGDQSMAHPVGTGPFRLVEWRRASRIVLERNPHFRELRYHAEPAADDAEGQRIARALAGRRLPMVDRVEIAVIDEAQPRWLAFLNGETDFIELPDLFKPVAAPGGKLAPYLARRGIGAHLLTLPATYYTMFNMEHPVVGGYTPQKVALRRAIGLGIDVRREIALLRNGAGVTAQSAMAVHLSGFDPSFRCEMGEYDPARARALLDLYGYTDRDGDGWREQPDGQPLVLEMATQPTQSQRRYDELMKRDMAVLGLKMVFRPAQWPEQYKAARAGKLMMWDSQGRAGSPDGMNGLYRYDGAAAGGFNLARFDRPEMNAAIAQLLALPDGPERERVFHETKRIAAAWMPYKLRTHPVQIYLTAPRISGYRPPLFRSNWYEYVDVTA